MTWTISRRRAATTVRDELAFTRYSGLGGGLPMTLDEVCRVLDAVSSTGCRYWLQGGWGVDALVARQTREHRDLDVDFDADYEAAVIGALGELGYVIETDWRPTRVELAAPGRGWVDLHPLTIAADGSATQAALGGRVYKYAAAYFTEGCLGDRVVPCISASAQMKFREGYEHRPADTHDLAVLRDLAPGDRPAAG
jgi:lincosamide nucleotidyltransferase A/C/D/E